MHYKIGSKVIYPAHGTAKIVARTTRTFGGETVDYLELVVPERGYGTSGDMRVLVPEAKASELGVRAAISADEANVAPRTRLAIGEAVIEVSTVPHNGCATFGRYFGADAVRFVNTPSRRHLHLRGINARVVSPGRVRPGDTVRKVGDEVR